MDPTPFAALADLAQWLESTRSRTEMAERIATFLRALAPDEVAPAVRLLTGQVFAESDARALNVSWAAVAALVDELTAPTPEDQQAIRAEAVDGGEAIRLLLTRARREPPRPPAPTLLEVQAALEGVAATAGARSRERKAALLRGLLERMSPAEAKLLVKDVLGEVRHGAGEGIMLEAIARAAGLAPGVLRRANMRWGDLGRVAAAALGPDPETLSRGGVQLFRPLKPMLAQTAETMEQVYALQEGPFALEYKLDGARVQIHKDGQTVRIYSRQQSEVTASLPDLVEQIAAWPGAQQAVLDGEAIAVDPEGRPLPFQEVMRRFRRQHGVGDMVREVPVRLYLFDALLLDGRSLIDQPYAERWQALQQAAAGLTLAPRSVPADLAEAKAFARQAAAEGHEGVMAKSLAGPYTPGARGRHWLKLKQIISLDLAIVAADWGYGRRHGWLSNYHLAVRDEATGQYALVGKTFKGLTDEEFAAMTQRLLALEEGRHGGTVTVRPQVVVEVLFGEIQASPKYPSGLALRFARIARIRDDKAASEVDTLATLRGLYEQQFEAKGRPGVIRDP